MGKGDGRVVRHGEGSMTLFFLDSLACAESVAPRLKPSLMSRAGVYTDGFESRKEVSGKRPMTSPRRAARGPQPLSSSLPTTSSSDYILLAHLPSSSSSMLDPLFRYVGNALSTPEDYVKVRSQPRSTIWPPLPPSRTETDRLVDTAARLLPSHCLPSLVSVRQASDRWNAPLLLHPRRHLLPRRHSQALERLPPAAVLHRRHLPHRRLQQDRTHALARLRLHDGPPHDQSRLPDHLRDLARCDRDHGHADGARHEALVVRLERLRRTQGYQRTFSSSPVTSSPEGETGVDPFV